MLSFFVTHCNRRAEKEAVAAEEDEKSMTYQEIETDIYGDTNTFKATSDYALKFRLKGKDDGKAIVSDFRGGRSQVLLFVTKIFKKL